MRHIILLLPAVVLSQCAAFQPMSVTSRPLHQIYSSVPSFDDTIETSSSSASSAVVVPPSAPQDLMLSLEQPSLKVASLVALSAIVGGLVVTHTDSTAVHTLEHVVQAWGSNAWKSYEAVLASNPISTKAATSATVYSIGDVIAQKSEENYDGKLDIARIARSGLAGGIGHGPLSHFWYNLSEHFFNNIVHLTAWWSFAPKIVVDQTVWGPIWNSSYILLLGLMKREGLEKMVQDVKSTTLPLFFDGLKLWPMAHVITYGFIPVENRLLWVDLVEILWVSILAAKASSLSPKETLER